MTRSHMLFHYILFLKWDLLTYTLEMSVMFRNIVWDYYCTLSRPFFSYPGVFAQTLPLFWRTFASLLVIVIILSSTFILNALNFLEICDSKLCGKLLFYCIFPTSKLAIIFMSSFSFLSDLCLPAWGFAIIDLCLLYEAFRTAWDLGVVRWSTKTIQINKWGGI